MPADNDQSVLEVSGLGKRYPGGSKDVLNDLNLRVEKGEIFGLLGSNGAGKTTTISILSTLIKPTRGSVRICGVDALKHPVKVRRLISLIPQEIALFPKLTGRENMRYFGTLYGLKKKALGLKISETLALFDLDDFADELAGKCSGGIQRRFNIACGILHDPALIFLDEPTVGMDVPSRNALLARIQQLSLKGSTLIYTTHYMEEAEKICSRVLIMDKGICLAQGATRDLISGNDKCRDLNELFLTATGKETNC
ncbi:ABC transporter ATP-binding protein [Desulfobacter vibrioformis]|uniref:ABC transporter ATP-binding protein n=1 Tax=Desulfobacter vibrioformis TaxID=34031 RepID=UPI000552700C|nr:ABC transporter ATP-binding protein [Desulfobacter vibrioformis]